MSRVDMLLSVTRPLLPSKRNELLIALAEALQGREDIGDGELFLLLRKLQQRFFDPPTLSDHPEPRPSVAR
jgi:hypothetical protein